MSGDKPTALDKAKAAWGEPLPEWVEALAREATASSMTQVADRLKLSLTMVSQGISNRYGRDGKGRIETLIAAVRTHLLHDQIDCPVLGVILKAECADWRVWMTRPGGANPNRAAMARACKACVHFSPKEGGGHAE